MQPFHFGGNLTILLDRQIDYLRFGAEIFFFAENIARAFQINHSFRVFFEKNIALVAALHLLVHRFGFLKKFRLILLFFTRESRESLCVKDADVLAGVKGVTSSIRRHRRRRRRIHRRRIHHHRLICAKALEVGTLKCLRLQHRRRPRRRHPGRRRPCRL